MRYLICFLFLAFVLMSQVLYVFHNHQFFDRQFDRLGSYERNPLVMQEAIALMQYRRDDRVLIDRDVYTHAEQEHLYDIKQILHWIVRLMIFCVVLIGMMMRLRYIHG